MILSEWTESVYHKSPADCTNEELYFALLGAIRARANERLPTAPPKKKLYYLSAEFLIGKLLSNNLINLGIYDEVKRELAQYGKSLAEMEEIEPEPSLGNGGLGRLAACFLDSIATLGLPGDGIGLCYHFGLFRQVFANHVQNALPDKWLSDRSPLRKTSTFYSVRFGQQTLIGRMYDLDIVGYDSITNTLHLFDVEGVDEKIVGGGIDFDKTDIGKNLTLFLYPDDSDENGRLLRIYQQYFMVSCAAQLILDEAVAKGCQLYDLADYAVIQINDTHPTLIIPELIRLLTERGLDVDRAIEAVSRACAYTNHTILSEALEKWQISALKKVVPKLVPIIEVLDDKVRRKFDDPRVHIIDKNDTVHMAHIDIHCSTSVNGVASLHTNLLKNEELNHFYKIYPDKFNNKTNGITFRRWLLYCNPALTQLLTELIGDGFKKDADELKKLLDFKDDTEVLEQLLAVKAQNKALLADWLQKKQGVRLNIRSIFDIQIKRLHEYKRQQLNALYVIHKYLEIKAGKLPSTPITVIFGAKAAPAYTIAQDVIHLILCLQTLVNGDPAVREHLQVITVENYNVTAAEKLIPACDISEQISLASKEASGTGNMKFMLSGAVTLGTEDGANVEIHALVGDENVYIFGDSSDTVVKRYKEGSYRPQEVYAQNAALRQAVDFITGEKLMRIGDPARLKRLSEELMQKDYFMTFPDFDDYVQTRERAYADYENRLEWAKKMLVNIANAGYFSSDRTVAEYNREIWKLR